MTILLWIFIVILGLSLGSFVTCAAYRLPRKLPLWGAGYNQSFCPSCKHVLGIRDLVPVLSWVFLRGKCRHCGARIGVRYVLIELVVLAVVLFIFGHIAQ
jgi:leader peptidase (prepilin peptidase)/N-methyltransferase